MSATILTTAFQDLSSVGPRRKFCLIGSSDCVVAFESAPTLGSSSGARIKAPFPPAVVDAPPAPATDLILSGPSMSSPAFDDASTFVRYVLLSGTVTSCWVDALFPGAATAGAATTSVLGTSEMSVAPAVAATPIAVGTNDARVCTVEFPLALSGTDGSLTESVVWRAPYNCTITGALITSPATMAADNTNFDTFTLANRPLAGPGTPATIVTTTTKSTGLNGLTAWTEASLGALSNTAVLAGDMLTFKSVATASGKASGPGLLRVTFTVP